MPGGEDFNMLGFVAQWIIHKLQGASAPNKYTIENSQLENNKDNTTTHQHQTF